MAGKKLTISDALSFLRDEGYSVAIEKMEEKPIPERRVAPNRGKKKGTTRITLYGEHKISSGKQNYAFGPGRNIDVPDEFVRQLLHQDQQARKADEAMRDTEFRSYLVVPRATAGGIEGVSKLSVDEEIFGGTTGFGNEVARAGNAHIIRGR